MRCRSAILTARSRIMARVLPPERRFLASRFHSDISDMALNATRRRLLHFACLRLPSGPDRPHMLGRAQMRVHGQARRFRVPFVDRFEDGGMLLLDRGLFLPGVV